MRIKNEKITAPTKGTIYILISAFSFGSYGIWSRMMSGHFGEFSQAWTRGLILAIVTLTIGFVFKLFKPIAKKDLKWFLMIALAGGLNQAPYFFGFEHLSVGTATLLFYAALVFGGYLLGKFIFNELLDRVKIISLIIAMFGLFTIYQFSLAPSQILPASLTIMAGLMGAISAVLPKKLSSDYPEVQIMSGYFIVMIIANGILSSVFNDPLPQFVLSVPWLGQLSYSVAMLVANVTVIMGFKYLDASIGSLIGLAEVMFAAIFGYFFFSEILSTSTIVGGILIIVAAILPNIGLFNKNVK